MCHCDPCVRTPCCGRDCCKVPGGCEFCTLKEEPKKVEVQSDAELRALHAATTKGPWKSVAWNHPEPDEDTPLITGADDAFVVGNMYYDGYHAACSKEDVTFMVAAHEAVPALLDRLEAAKRERDSYMGAHAKVCALYDKAWPARDAAERRVEALERVMGQAVTRIQCHGTCHQLDRCAGCEVRDMLRAALAATGGPKR